LTADGGNSGTDVIIIKGSGAINVTTDANGIIDINSPNIDIANASTAGLVQPFSVIEKPTINAVSTTSNKYYHVQMSNDGNMFVNVPWTDNNTDTKVTQTASTTNGEFPLLLRGTSADTSNITASTTFATSIKANPSTGTITATKFDGLATQATQATSDNNGNNIADTYMTQENPTGTGRFSLNGSATGTNSFAEGCDTSATGDYSHAEGYKTIASGTSSHAEGCGVRSCKIWNVQSTVDGYRMTIDDPSGLDINDKLIYNTQSYTITKITTGTPSYIYTKTKPNVTATTKPTTSNCTI
jgi:hypothetical protein